MYQKHAEILVSGLVTLTFGLMQFSSTGYPPMDSNTLSKNSKFKIVLNEPCLSRSCQALKSYIRYEIYLSCEYTEHQTAATTLYWKTL